MVRSRAAGWGWGAAAMVWLSLCAPAAEIPPMPAAELVRLTVQNEVKASQNPSTPHMFVSLKETPRGSQTKLYCETKDAMAGMAIAYDRKPLTAQQRLAEEARLDQLANSPVELAKKRQREKEDADRVGRIVRPCRTHSFSTTTAPNPASPESVKRATIWFG